MKKLFTCLESSLNYADYYKDIIECLKNCHWERAGDDKFFCTSVPKMVFYKMTAIDVEFFGHEQYKYEIIYSKCVDGQFSWEVNFYENEECQYNDYLLIDNDDLELFTKTETPDTVENFFNDNLGEIVQKIKNSYPEVYNAIQNEENSNYDLDAALHSAVDNLGECGVASYIEDNFSGISDVIRDKILEDLSTDDVPDYLKEDIARDWCESNPEDAWEIAEDNMDSCDVKEKIIGYLERNL